MIYAFVMTIGTLLIIAYVVIIIGWNLVNRAARKDKDHDNE